MGGTNVLRCGKILTYTDSTTMIANSIVLREAARSQIFWFLVQDCLDRYYGRLKKLSKSRLDNDLELVSRCKQNHTRT